MFFDYQSAPMPEGKFFSWNQWRKILTRFSKVNNYGSAPSTLEYGIENEEQHDIGLLSAPESAPVRREQVTSNIDRVLSSSSSPPPVAANTTSPPKSCNTSVDLQAVLYQINTQFAMVNEKLSTLNEKVDRLENRLENMLPKKEMQHATHEVRPSLSNAPPSYHVAVSSPSRSSASSQRPPAAPSSQYPGASQRSSNAMPEPPQSNATPQFDGSHVPTKTKTVVCPVCFLYFNKADVNAHVNTHLDRPSSHQNLPAPPPSFYAPRSQAGPAYPPPSISPSAPPQSLPSNQPFLPQNVPEGQIVMHKGKYYLIPNKKKNWWRTTTVRTCIL